MHEGETQPRRQGDVVLIEVRGELALLKQAVELGGKSTENAIQAVSEQVKGLAIKVDAAIVAQTNASAEPQASPMGRTLLEKHGNHELRIADLEKEAEDNAHFKTEMRTAFRTIRVQLTLMGTVIGIISGAAAIAAILK